ncbi:MAG: glucuronate isomerase [bacterium]|nr:glucuronate isomerase [bacterium]
MNERSPVRYFDPAHREIARQLYDHAAPLPLICPHGHVDPRLFAADGYDYGSPVDLLIRPDHYVFRMLYSQGIPLEALGIPRRDGEPVEADHRKIWAIFAEHAYLFRGTPTGLWLRDELADVFGIGERLTPANAQTIYDQIDTKLRQPDYQPRRLFERFNIEVLATTDPAASRLAHHQAIRASGWPGRVIPTFRPDAVIDLAAVGWRAEIDLLSDVTGMAISGYADYIRALEHQRAFFKAMGATATDHGVESPYTAPLSDLEAETLFVRALKGGASPDDAARFTGHMLIEMARMSADDGLVMQLHAGSRRNHHTALYERFGRDMGADIPIQTDFTRNLEPLLNRFGAHPTFTLVVFTLDESTYSRELAPLAGHYPALRLGPPWWFFDSLNGIRRYFEYVVETAGLYNTAGFNDDTRAYPSIPARHDVWRRACADWLAGLVARHIVEIDEAGEMMIDLAYRLARRTYRLGDSDTLH